MDLWPYCSNAVRPFLFLKIGGKYMKNEEKLEKFEKDYFDDLKRIKKTIRENQNKAMVVVNSAMIMTYYEIGTIINERKTWGSKYIQNLANDLKEYGKGYSFDQLKRMSQLASNFSFDEIRAQPVPQIPWSSTITIMQKSKSHEEMLFYINETHKHGWSRAMVLNQIEMKAYERRLKDDLEIKKSVYKTLYNQKLVYPWRLELQTH